MKFLKTTQLGVLDVAREVNSPPQCAGAGQGRVGLATQTGHLERSQQLAGLAGWISILRPKRAILGAGLRCWAFHSWNSRTGHADENAGSTAGSAEGMIDWVYYCEKTERRAMPDTSKGNLLMP